MAGVVLFPSLLASGLLCLLGLFTLVAAANAESPSLRSPLKDVGNLTAWQAYVGETFEVWGGNGARLVENLALTSVQALPSRPPISQFTLHFLAAHSSTLGKGIYGLRHPHSGHIELWLDPAGEDHAGRRYDARFSLLQNQTTNPQNQSER